MSFLVRAPIVWALLQAVLPQNAADLSESDLRDGQIVWATIDSPWLHKVDKDAFGRELGGIRKIAPRLILSNHLPPAPGHLMERFLGSLTGALPERTRSSGRIRPPSSRC